MRSNIPQFNARQIYLLLAVLLLAYGLMNLWAGARLVGEKYGGFLWIHDLSRQPPYYVGPLPWRTLHLTSDALQFVDTLVQIDGQPVETAAAVYAARRPGDLATYQVWRGQELLTIAEPLRLFSFDQFLLIHGLLFLIGLSALGSGWMLVSEPRRPYLTLVAFGLLPAAGAAFFFVGEYTSLTPDVHDSPLPYLLLGAPAPALIGGCFLHAALLYPEPPSWLRRFPSVLWLLYGLPFLGVAAFGVAEQMHWRETSELLLRSLHGLAALYFVGIALVGALTYRRLRRAGRWPELQLLQTVRVALLWLIGGMFVFWLGPFVLTGQPLLPYEVLSPFLALLPLVLMYSLRGGETLRMLNREVLLRRAQAEQIDLLRRSRDRTLHQVADRLHDYVLPELRGSQLLATRLQHKSALPADSQEDLSVLSNGLQSALVQTQKLIEGAKPMDWSSVTLGAALEQLATRYRRRSDAPAITVDVTGYDETDEEAVKDAFFAVAQLALDNAVRHAAARTVALTLDGAANLITLAVNDDGSGLDEEQVLHHAGSSRRLGLDNMRQRAEEIGAVLEITSGPQQGTCVQIVLRRELRPYNYSF